MPIRRPVRYGAIAAVVVAACGGSQRQNPPNLVFACELDTRGGRTIFWTSAAETQYPITLSQGNDSRNFEIVGEWGEPRG